MAVILAPMRRSAMPMACRTMQGFDVVERCYNSLLGGAANGGLYGEMENSDIIHLRDADAYLMPLGCGYKAGGKDGCKVGVRVQERRMIAALDYARKVSPLGKKFVLIPSGTPEEIERFKVTLAAYRERYADFAMPPVIYDDLSGKTYQHGQHTRELIEEMGGDICKPCMVFTDWPHMPRARISKAQVGLCVIPKTVRVSGENFLDTLHILKGELMGPDGNPLQGGILKNLLRGSFTLGEYIAHLGRPSLESTRHRIATARRGVQFQVQVT